MARHEKIQVLLNGTMRKCIASGETRDTSTLLRFVVGPGGIIFADILGKLPGKGIWVSCDKALLQKVVREGLFSYAARKTVTVPDTLLDDLEDLVSKRAISLLSLARKSGHAVAGYEKVKSWLAKDLACVLIQSCDGSQRGKLKLSHSRSCTIISWLKSSELGSAFGRQTVIHCALASGGITQRVVNEVQRLRGLRPLTGDLRVAHKEKTAI